MTLTGIQQKLIEIDSSKEMLEAIKSGIYFVEVTPCISGYCMGSLDEGVPALMATKEEAEAENKEMTEAYQQQIDEGTREAGDVWQGEVLTCHWDGVSEDMIFIDEKNNLVNQESWKSMMGI